MAGIRSFDISYKEDYEISTFITDVIGDLTYRKYVLVSGTEASNNEVWVDTSGLSFTSEEIISITYIYDNNGSDVSNTIDISYDSSVNNLKSYVTDDIHRSLLKDMTIKLVVRHDGSHSDKGGSLITINDISFNVDVQPDASLSIIDPVETIDISFTNKYEFSNFIPTVVGNSTIFVQLNDGEEVQTYDISQNLGEFITNVKIGDDYDGQYLGVNLSDYITSTREVTINDGDGDGDGYEITISGEHLYKYAEITDVSDKITGTFNVITPIDIDTSFSAIKQSQLPQLTFENRYDISGLYDTTVDSVTVTYVNGITGNNNTDAYFIDVANLTASDLSSVTFDININGTEVTSVFDSATNPNLSDFSSAKLSDYLTSFIERKYLDKITYVYSTSELDIQSSALATVTLEVDLSNSTKDTEAPEFFNLLPYITDADLSINNTASTTFIDGSNVTGLITVNYEAYTDISTNLATTLNIASDASATLIFDVSDNSIPSKPITEEEILASPYTTWSIKTKEYRGFESGDLRVTNDTIDGSGALALLEAINTTYPGQYDVTVTVKDEDEIEDPSGQENVTIRKFVVQVISTLDKLTITNKIVTDNNIFRRVGDETSDPSYVTVTGDFAEYVSLTADISGVKYPDYYDMTKTTDARLTEIVVDTSENTQNLPLGNAIIDTRVPGTYEVTYLLSADENTLQQNPVDTELIKGTLDTDFSNTPKYTVYLADIDAPKVMLNNDLEIKTLYLSEAGQLADMSGSTPLAEVVDHYGTSLPPTAFDQGRVFISSVTETTPSGEIISHYNLFDGSKFLRVIDGDNTTVNEYNVSDLNVNLDGTTLQTLVLEEDATVELIVIDNINAGYDNSGALVAGDLSTLNITSSNQVVVEYTAMTLEGKLVRFSEEKHIVFNGTGTNVTGAPTTEQNPIQISDYENLVTRTVPLTTTVVPRTTSTRRWNMF